MKKCIAMLVAVLMLSLSLLQVNAAGLLFIDPTDEQYYEVLTDLGVLSLYQNDEGFFDGAKGVSRGEAAIAISGLIGVQPSLNSSIVDTFIDVLPTEPASGSIATMVSAKAMSGFGDNLFRPYDTIQTVHFVKALLVALGYQWRADSLGGYPTGYMKIAGELELLDGVTVKDGQPLTRSELFKILYNALDAQVYDVVGVSGDATRYETSKKTTVLTQFHNIYEETAVVNSNSMTSLNASFKANDKTVLLGTERVYLQDDVSIWSYLGQTVTYFYKQEEGGSRKVLVSFALDENEIVTLTGSNIDGVSNGEVEYADAETGKIRKLAYNIGTDIVYNGGRDAINLRETLNNLSGTADFIDNDEDGVVDVIIINDYRYDVVKGMDLTGEVLYCDNENIDLDAATTWVIESETGGQLALSELVAGDVLAIAKSVNGELVRVVRLASSITGTAKQRGTDTITVEDTSYVVSSGANTESLAKVKLGGSYTFYLNIAGEIVYAVEGSADSLKLGYLITYGAESNAFDSKIFLKILTASSVNVFEVKEKIQINGNLVESKDVIATLRNLKNQLSLASDGEISQVIRYTVDSNKMLSAIYTAKTTENEELMLKYNSAGSPVACRKFYGVATISAGREFLGNNGSTVFVVPKDNQATLPEDYYGVTQLDTEIQDNKSYTVETYVAGDSIMPFAIVVYPETAVAGGVIPPDASIMMLESLEKVVNNDGAPVTKFNVYKGNSKLSYLSENTIDTTGLEPGDTIVLQLSPLNEVQKFGKVYDASEGQFCIDPDYNVSYEATALNPGSGGTPPGRSIMKYSLYRREGNYILATNKGFSNMDTALDNMYAVDLSRHATFPMYDSEKDEVSLVTTDSLIEYVRDNENYSELLILYYWNSIFTVVVYK